MSKLPESCLAWRCNECLAAYTDEDEALDCCQPTISEGFICPTCRTFHKGEEAAIDCCGWSPEDPPPRPTHAELEAAGQMRLPI